MTAKEGKLGLRPTLPDEIDQALGSLIKSAWEADFELRPSFSVILIQLDIIMRNAAVEQAESEILERQLEDEKAVRALARGFVDLLWSFAPTAWDQSKAQALVDDSATTSAKDPTLDKILSSSEGLDCVKSLGWMMFGGLEDGAKILIEPLLDSDIIIDLEKGFAIVRIPFVLKAPDKNYQWTGSDDREFVELQKALLDAGRALEGAGTDALDKAVSASALQDEQKKNNKRRKKKRRGLRDSLKAAARARNTGMAQRHSRKDKDLALFIKAARYVRGIGAGSIHPSAKIRFFGLLMQAQRGDIPDEGALELRGLKGSARALQELKLKAWRGEKGRDQKECMLEYVEVLTSMAPQWKVAHMLGGSLQSDDPR